MCIGRFVARLLFMLDRRSTLNSNRRMNKKLLLAGLLVAAISPAVHAAGLNLEGGADSISGPALIAPLKTDGGFLGQFRASPMSNPRTLYINNGYKLGVRAESLRTLGLDSEGGTILGNDNGYPNGGNNNGNNGTVHVPEPDGLGAMLAAGIFGLGFAGYSVSQRRRVHGAA